MLLCSGYAVGSHLLFNCGKENLPGQVSKEIVLSVSFVALFTIDFKIW